MLIDNRVFEPYTIELNSPLTDEQWDILDDVDFDHTEHIWFHTKHGKEVHFYKNAIPIEWLKAYFKKCLSFNDRVFIDNEDSNYDIVIDKYKIFEEWEKENETN